MELDNEQGLEANVRALFYHLVSVSGRITLPCVPALMPDNLQLLDDLFTVLNHRFSTDEIEQLGEGMIELVDKAFVNSPNSRLVIEYQPNELPETGLSCKIATINVSTRQRYQQWLESREPPELPTHIDAKVSALPKGRFAHASQFSNPSNITILDIGAGKGRNSIPLARLGYQVDAIELAPGFVEQMREIADAEKLPLQAIEGDFFDPLLRINPAYYQCAIASEIIASQWRDLKQIRLFLAKLCDSVVSDGLILFSVFLFVPDYEPDIRIQELSQVYWSYAITRAELATAMAKLPLEIVSEESVFDYEFNHLEPEIWSDLGWYHDWMRGKNLFPKIESSLIELRWLLCRRL